MKAYASTFACHLRSLELVSMAKVATPVNQNLFFVTNAVHLPMLYFVQVVGTTVANAIAKPIMSLGRLFESCELLLQNINLM
jgi:energy-converting hydrogenase Eha subunit G